MKISHKRKQSTLFVAAILAVFFFSLIIAQFFRLQVLEHRKWKKRAMGQHYFMVKEPFRRGTFYSNTSIRKGDEGKEVAFAIDVPLFHLYADPKSIPESVHGEIVQAIIRLLAPEMREATKLSSELKRKSRSRRLVSFLREHDRQAFCSFWYPFAKEHKLPSNALFFVSDFKRFHPMGRLLGQTLHTIQDRRDDATGRAYPTGGLELSLNKLLEGSVGLRRLMRSPRNSLETGEVLRTPRHGLDVELTVNHCLQAIVEEELEKGVKQARAKGGVAIMVDPRTGEILALAQYPFFHPDRYKEYFNDKKLIEYAKLQATQDANEPGSPMKAFTISLALKTNKILKERGQAPIFSPAEKIATNSGSFPGRKKPITDTHFYKFLNMNMGVQRSSNIYMATLGGRIVKAMGDEWYRSELTKTFGFSKKTGIELSGESIGVMPTPGKLHPNGRAEWSKATPYSLAIGYNIQATGLQMVRAYSVLANGGTLPELTLVRRVFKRTSEGREVIFDNTLHERMKYFPKVLDEDIVSQVVHALKLVTKTGGTASRGNIHGYTEAGKTGTSYKLINGQYSNKAYYASFVGFAPASCPAFVLYIGIDEPWVGYIPGRGFNQQGGSCAAPIFREIGKRTLEFLGVPQDDPYGFPQGDPRCSLKKQDMAEENEKLSKLFKEWNE